MVFANPPVLELAIVSMIFGSAQLALIAYFVSYLNLELGYGLVAAGLIYSSAHAAGIVGRIAWGAVADRWLSPRSMLGLLGVMMALSGVGVASFSADWPLPAVILVSVLFGASAVGWNGVYLAEVARLAPPGQVGAITGGTQFFTFIGALAAPPLFGFVAGLAGGYGRAYLAFCLLPALAGLRLLRGARLTCRRTPSTDVVREAVILVHGLWMGGWVDAGPAPAALAPRLCGPYLRLPVDGAKPGRACAAARRAHRRTAGTRDPSGRPQPGRPGDPALPEESRRAAHRPRRADRHAGARLHGGAAPGESGSRASGCSAPAATSGAACPKRSGRGANWA